MLFNSKGGVTGTDSLIISLRDGAIRFKFDLDSVTISVADGVIESNAVLISHPDDVILCALWLAGLSPQWREWVHR